jgi:hypothetical protein
MMAGVEGKDEQAGYAGAGNGARVPRSCHDDLLARKNFAQSIGQKAAAERTFLPAVTPFTLSAG